MIWVICRRRHGAYILKMKTVQYQRPFQCNMTHISLTYESAFKKSDVSAIPMAERSFLKLNQRNSSAIQLAVIIIWIFWVGIFIFTSHYIWLVYGPRRHCFKVVLWVIVATNINSGAGVQNVISNRINGQDNEKKTNIILNNPLNINCWTFFICMCN